MSFGIVITKPGVDVSGSNSPKDIILSTLYPVLKIKSEGEDSVTLLPFETVKTYEITHNLGYKAQTWVYSDTAPGSSYRARANRLGYIDIEFQNNKSIITFRDLNTGSSRVYGFYYYVFYDEVTQ